VRPRARPQPTKTIRVDRDTLAMVATLAEDGGAGSLTEAARVLVIEGWKRTTLPYEGGRCVVEWSPLANAYVTSFVTDRLPDPRLIDDLNRVLAAIWKQESKP